MNSFEDFSLKIETLQQKMIHLSQDSHSSQTQTSDIVEQALIELTAALEELHIADEELHTQNEQLAVANFDAAQAEARFQHLFEYAPDGYLVTDQHGVIQKANRAAVNLALRSVDKMIGKPLAILIIQEDHHKIYSFLNHLKEDN